jgi:hypothetical protein
MKMKVGQMEAVSQDHRAADPYYDELNRLFNLYRLANLNARYYGCRAEQFERKSTWTTILSALVSALALAVLLGVERPWVKPFAAALSGIAAVITGVTPFFGWAERIRDLRSLRFAYSQLFGQIEFAITDIKRAGTLTAEHIGLARMVHEGFMRVEAMDELEPDQKLLDVEDAKVKKAIPEDYLWTHL